MIESFPLVCVASVSSVSLCEKKMNPEIQLTNLGIQIMEFSIKKSYSAMAMVTRFMSFSANGCTREPFES